MRCCICKKYLNPNRGNRFTRMYETRNGHLRHKTWCKRCDVEREDEVDRILKAIDEGRTPPTSRG